MDYEEDDDEGSVPSLNDLKVGEKWGAEYEDLLLLKEFGVYFVGKRGLEARTFPGHVRTTPVYKKIIERGRKGINAKTILAVLRESYRVERISRSYDIVGSMAERPDEGLDVFREVALPLLVEDLAVEAGWGGFRIPSTIESIQDHAERTSQTKRFTRDWILNQLSVDAHMMHYVNAVEEAMLKRLTAEMMVVDKIALAQQKEARGQKLDANEGALLDDLDILKIAAMTDDTVMRMLMDKNIAI